MSDPSTEALLERLEAIDHKLDYVVERQRYFEEWVRDMTPVAREAVTLAAGRLAEWEDRGWFAMGHELVGLFDRLAAAYGPEDVQELADHIVLLVDTARNVTQPDVLDLANSATDVLHHADEVEPVGAFGAAAATRDPEVRHGLAIAMAFLRELGRMRGGTSVDVRDPAPSRARTREEAPSQPSGDTTGAPTSATRPSPAESKSAPAAPVDEEVVWEGRRFTSEGYLVETEAWDEALAEKMAAGLEVPLTEEHWQVIRWARQEFLTSGASPNVRRIALGSGIGARRLYQLFPSAPGRLVAMIAGIGKPVGCV